MVPDALTSVFSGIFIFQIFRHFLARKFQLGYVQEYHQKHLDAMTHHMQQTPFWTKKDYIFNRSKLPTYQS